MACLSLDSREKNSSNSLLGINKILSVCLTECLDVPLVRVKYAVATVAPVVVDQAIQQLAGSQFNLM